MAPNNQQRTKRAIMEARRRRVAALKLRGLTVREIQAELADPAKGMVNPKTGKAYSLSTIGADLVILQKRWREASAKDIAKHKARELAELGEHRKSAWAQRELGEIRLGIALEMKLLGTAEPERREFSGPGGGPIPITEIEVRKPAKDESLGKEGDDGDDGTDGDGQDVGSGRTTALET